MNHSYEKISGNKAKLSFTIPAEAFDEAIQKAYLKMRGRINIPGFRKGKAPKKLIETMYGESVFYDEAFEALFPEAYREAVEASDLHPVDRPDVDIQEIGAGKDLVFSCEVFVSPDVTLGQYQELTVEHEPNTVTEAQIDAHIEQEREKVARMSEVTDRPLQDGDIVKLNYAGSVDGVPFEGGTAVDQLLTLGSHSFIPGFEEQMIGLNIGDEKDLPVTFPTEYHASELAGKEAVFHVVVHSAQTKELPELDDDFAQDVSDFNTLTDYRLSIREQLEVTARENDDIVIENLLVDKAVANATVDIPHAMIHDETETMLREMQMRMMYQGISMDDFLKYTGQTMDGMRESYHADAEKRVKTRLVLETIRDAEEIVPTDVEVEKQIEEQAKRSGKELDAFKESLTDDMKAYLKDSAAIQKTIEMMKLSCTVVKPADAEKTEEAPAPEQSAPAKPKAPGRRMSKKAKQTEPAEAAE